MRILLLSSLTLALCAATAHAQTYRTARSEPAPARQSAEAPPAAAASHPGAQVQNRRQHALYAQQMARAHHASSQAGTEEETAPAAGPAAGNAPLPLGDAIIVNEAPEPDGE